MHNGKVIYKSGEYEIIDCDNCGFKHVMPIPSQKDLNKVYEEEYYTTEKPQFIERQIEDIAWWNTVYDDRYDYFENNLARNRRRILDIGCGPGFFLKRGKERGWKGVGVEPSKQAAEHAIELGLEVFNNFLDDANLEKKHDKFDVVHMSEVLEHIPNPLDLCKKAYHLLDRKGVICVVVPNDFNPFQTALNKKMSFQQYWVAPPHHINYFSYDSLQALLEKSGFKVMHKEAMFPMEVFLFMGDNYVNDDIVGRKCHARRKLFELNLVNSGLNKLKTDIYSFFASRNVGREIVMYGQKI